MTQMFMVEGLPQVLAAMDAMSKATNRNVCRRALRLGGEPVAQAGERAAPEATGFLSFSIVVSPTLSRRQKRERLGRSETEMYVGPAGGRGVGGAALLYASFVEFGTVKMPAQPYLRPAWEATKGIALRVVSDSLKSEVNKAAQRQARKAARLAAKAASTTG